MKLTEEGKEARASLRKASTIVTDVSGRRYNASTGKYEESNNGFVVDTSPDPGLYECIPGLFIGSQDAAQNYEGITVSKPKKGKRPEIVGSKEEDQPDQEFFPGMEDLGITHVVNLFSKDRPFENHGIKYLNVVMLDVPEQSLSTCLDEILQFIHQALSISSENKPDPPSKVLVHCNAGVSRSSTIIIAYLIKYKGMTYQQALELVRKNRPSAKPNHGFETQLIEMEKGCR